LAGAKETINMESFIYEASLSVHNSQSSAVTLFQSQPSKHIYDKKTDFQELFFLFFFLFSTRPNRSYKWKSGKRLKIAKKITTTVRLVSKRMAIDRTARS
jgi:hypothetical protein